MDMYEVLKRPIVTEKSSKQSEYHHCYTFEVDVRANKQQIKDAVEQIFNVQVLDVNVINVRGKQRRWGRIIGRTKDWKKAIVTLAPGQSIQFFEGV
ncbi:MAG: 50S ribosomal protein L23 [Anaerolineae bacterium]